MAYRPPWYVVLVGGFFFVFWAGYWVVHLLALVYARWRLYAKPGKQSLQQQLERSPEDPWPGVSILKPLVGFDQNLPWNLETFFAMHYPGRYELLFCVSDTEDPALGVCKALMDKYPAVDARILVGGEKVGDNPKINNMEPGYNAAKYDLVMISDSGLRMREDTLTDMVSHLGENVGLVHQMPFVCDREGFASVVEKVYFGTCLARIYLVADLLGINSVTGMSCLFRKCIVDELGGLRAFGCYLAEDYFLGLNIQKKGYKLRVTSQPAWQNPAPGDIPSFQARIRRWTQLRIAMVPTTIILEPLQECVVLGLCTSWAAHALFCWDPLVFFLVHCLSWFLMDYCLLTIVNGNWLSFTKFEFLLAWLFREFNAFRQFLQAFADPVIRWRTGAYRLRWGGMIQEVEPVGPSAAAALKPKPSPLSSSSLSLVSTPVPSLPSSACSPCSTSPVPVSSTCLPVLDATAMVANSVTTKHHLTSVLMMPNNSSSIINKKKKRRPASSACSSYPTHFPPPSHSNGGGGSCSGGSSNKSLVNGNVPFVNAFERDAPW